MSVEFEELAKQRENPTEETQSENFDCTRCTTHMHCDVAFLK